MPRGKSPFTNNPCIACLIQNQYSLASIKILFHLYNISLHKTPIYDL